jgi:predicted peptidase
VRRVALGILASSPTSIATGERVAQSSFTFENGPARHDRLACLLHVPRGRPADGAAAWPLVLFLHGSGERGDDLEAVKREGLPRLVERDGDFPFVVVSPQCPAGEAWYRYPRTLVALLDRLLESQPVDPARVYLTGISMGGYGTWGLAARHPRRFAAIVPICGGGLRTDGFPERIAALREVPVWAFHGALDDSVAPEESQRLVDALRTRGGDVRFTLYPDLGHDCWTRAYGESALYAWMLSHRLSSASAR